jgi:ParB family chromosome partitioning protein
VRGRKEKEAGRGELRFPDKVQVAFLRKTEESAFGCLLVKIVILQSAHSTHDYSRVLKEAADLYKEDVNAITAKVKQESAA